MIALSLPGPLPPQGPKSRRDRIMRKLLFCLTAAVAVAGCTSESNHSTSDSASTQAQPVKAALATAIDRATGRSSVASLPDRGALLAFDAVIAPSRDGATALYPVRLSEAHALNAAAPGGAIELATPAGETMRFAYASHSEDTLGNWTWVGNTADGLSAVITFGKDAVFGQIALPGAAPLQLTTRNGRTWLGVIDSSRALSAHLLRKGKPDVLIPRIAAAGAAIAAGGKAAPAQPGFAVKASPANTVDVALGFTPGMVTTYGSVSGVNTRLTNLVAVANAAYQRSQVTPRVRLVHTMQVNYTDTNSNEAALNALTGFVCNPSCTPTAVPAELQPLRNARDQFGADLVSLVRPLRAPQNEGCGIAWLIGGDGDTIDNSYTPFGYSVVSDGQDLDETDGNNYLCYVETLAHELGHNMGQAHNTQDSSQQGAHTYSYGYRETSTTGFFTIMAYPLANSSQFPISYFSNPSVNDSGTGRVTGTATADNARSLNQTMPLVAQFRAAVVPFAGGARNDLNGNGTSDLFWFNTGSSQMAYWLMNGTTTVSTGLYAVGPSFRIAGTGDLDGDGRADIIWRDNTTNYHYLWRSRGDGTFDTPFLGAIGPGWVVAGVTDINGDGRADIIWENTGSGQMAYWLMNGATQTGSGVYSVGTAFRIAGVGDLDGDGRGDILWTNASAGFLYLWRSRGDGTFDTPFVAAYGTTWSIAGITDLNGDGRGDIVWEEPTQGLMAYWWMNGATVQSTGLRSVGTSYRIATTGDLDGDGRGDIVWANSGSGLLFLWRSLGNGNFDTPFLASYSPSWALIR